MWSNPQETVNLVIFAEEILNAKPHFLCGGDSKVNGKGTAKGQNFPTEKKIIAK